MKFTHATAKALDRHLRQRAQHPDAHLPFLWLSQKGGALTPGVRFSDDCSRVLAECALPAHNGCVGC